MLARLLKNKKYLVHLVFWFGFFMVFVFFWSARLDWADAFLRSAIVTSLEAIITYFNLHLLVPRYFMKKRYLLYGIIVSLIVFASIAILQFASPLPSRELMMPNQGRNRQEQQLNKDADQFSFENNMPPRRRLREGNPPSRPRPEILMHLARQARNLFNGFLTFGVILISTAVGVSQIAFKKEKEATLYKSEKTQAEMKFLKSQINPHFLFNALNSAYTLAYIKDDEAPKVILSISDMLRYLIYECEADRVPLEKEMTYIKNYIAIQQTRLENPKAVKVTWEIENERLMVAPMIFIPFIENSFKHSHIENTKTGTIEIFFKTDKNAIHFSVYNSLPIAAYTKDKVGGIGLDNVKRRLELLYPKRHLLDISQTETQFIVNLKLELA